MNGSDLTAAPRGRALFHACIVTGGTEEARRAYARSLAAAMVCTGEESLSPCGVCQGCKKTLAGIHPDVITIAGEDGKSVNVAGVRALRADAYVRPNEAERKVYLLERADEMNDAAQNAMLKLLEEGPAYAAFLLLAESAPRLLQTVRSRCELLRLDEPAQAALPGDAVRDAADALAERYLSGDEAGFFTALVPCEKWERDALASLLDALTARFRDRLLAHPDGADRLSLLHGIATAETLRDACAFNAAPGHLCGWLCGALFEQKTEP